MLRKIYLDGFDQNYTGYPDVAPFNSVCEPLINTANKWAGNRTATKFIGRLRPHWKKLECPDKLSTSLWFNYLRKNEPLFVSGMDKALEKIADSIKKIVMPFGFGKVQNSAMLQMPIIAWLYNFVGQKSIQGFGEELEGMRECAREMNLPFRPSTDEEDGQNIDGWIGDKPVQWKGKKWYAPIVVRSDILYITRNKKTGKVKVL